MNSEFFLKINSNVVIYRSQSKNITLIQVFTPSQIGLLTNLILSEPVMWAKITRKEGRKEPDPSKPQKIFFPRKCQSLMVYLGLHYVGICGVGPIFVPWAAGLMILPAGCLVMTGRCCPLRLPSRPQLEQRGSWSSVMLRLEYSSQKHKMPLIDTVKRDWGQPRSKQTSWPHLFRPWLPTLLLFPSAAVQTPHAVSLPNSPIFGTHFWSH